MVTDERMIVKEGARYWWVFLVSGVVWLLIAWLVLRLNSTSIATVGVLLGWCSSWPGSTRSGWPP